MILRAVPSRCKDGLLEGQTGGSERTMVELYMTLGLWDLLQRVGRHGSWIRGEVDWMHGNTSDRSTNRVVNRWI